MEAAHLIAFNLTLLAAMASPGPALLYALRNAVAGGLAVGLATGAGLGLMAAAWTGFALIGLEGLFRLVPWAYGAMKLAGALYLIWIAQAMWRDARRPLAEGDGPHGRAALGRAFGGGILVNLANPKSVLFAGAVLLVIFPPGLAPAEKALIVLNHFIVELVVYAGFAALLSTRQARAGYLRAKTVLDRIAAVVLGALGLRLLIDR